MTKDCEECQKCTQKEACDEGADWIKCCMIGNHEYGEKICKCGTTFCYSCCRATNVDQGGKYKPNYMLCPTCGADYYKEYYQEV